ncbi:hypothetical protein H6784_03820 [Candidatus Nomurabacteria bacterium]|nr:hypothetical protein [Candidatus Kaiserbacteria bacterium]MCB9814517.1 hypothetical protein [Candidatus Nomurabacteria bacterium]
MRTLIIFLITIVSLSASPALAQLDTNSLTNPESTIETKPEYPRPGEEVTATLKDYQGSTYGSKITWLLDDQVIEEAENQREVKIIAGEAGKTQNIKVVLNTPQGSRVILQNTINPIYLDIIIEPQTRTPDFYLGRSLPSIGSIVNATALVSDSGFRDSDLVYTWRLNNQVLEGGPIRGRNQISFTTPIGDYSSLYLQVTEPGGVVLAKRAVSIPSVAPEVHFYEVSSLFGISQKPIAKNLSLIGNSVTVRAEPYNLDSRVYNNPDIKEWKVNGNKSTDFGGNPYEVTLQRTGTFGQSSVQFHVRDTKQILQGAQSNILINF